MLWTQWYKEEKLAFTIVICCPPKISSPKPEVTKWTKRGGGYIQGAKIMVSLCKIECFVGFILYPRQIFLYQQFDQVATA